MGTFRRAKAREQKHAASRAKNAQKKKKFSQEITRVCSCEVTVSTGKLCAQPDQQAVSDNPLMKLAINPNNKKVL